VVSKSWMSQLECSLGYKARVRITELTRKHGRVVVMRVGAQ
jgi:hypothetical protein